MRRRRDPPAAAATGPGGFETRTVRWLEEPFAASALRIGKLALTLPYACSGDFDGDGRTDVAALLVIAGGKTLRTYHQSAPVCC